MNYEELLKLIDKLDQSSIAYVEFNQGIDKVVLAKEVPHQMNYQTNGIESNSTNSKLANRIENQVNAQQWNKSESFAETETVTKGEEVLSPLVGVAYLQPKPDADSFVKVGDQVKKGQVLCIIEAMKLMNDIVSPFDGIVTEILVENEMVVEFNQPLIKIETI